MVLELMMTSRMSGHGLQFFRMVDTCCTFTPPNFKFLQIWYIHGGLTCRAMVPIERQTGDSCFMGLACTQNNKMERKRDVQMKIVELCGEWPAGSPPNLKFLQILYIHGGLTCRAMVLIERQTGDSCFMGLACKQNSKMKRKRDVQRKMVELCGE